jgi:hypothetical protein
LKESAIAADFLELTVGGSSSTSSSQDDFGLAAGGCEIGAVTGGAFAFSGSFLAGVGAGAFFLTIKPRSSESLSLPPKRSCFSLSFDERAGLAGAVLKLSAFGAAFGFASSFGLALKSKSNPPSASSSSLSTAKRSFAFFFFSAGGFPVPLRPETDNFP